MTNWMWRKGRQENQWLHSEIENIRKEAGSEKRMMSSVLVPLSCKCMETREGISPAGNCVHGSEYQWKGGSHRYPF